MKQLLMVLFALGSLTASAFTIDISQSKFRPVDTQEFVFEDMKIATTPGLNWGRFVWNAQTNSFTLVDFAPMTPSPVGRWDLAYDIGCDGSPGHTTWNLSADGSCISGENRTCRWVVDTQGNFTLNYLTGGRTIYRGKFTGGSMAGDFQSPDGGNRGCWRATKMNRLEYIRNIVDPRARRDSSGAFAP